MTAQKSVAMGTESPVDCGSIMGRLPGLIEGPSSVCSWECQPQGKLQVVRQGHHVISEPETRTDPFRGTTCRHKAEGSLFAHASNRVNCVDVVGRRLELLAPDYRGQCEDFCVQILPITLPLPPHHHHSTSVSSAHSLTPPPPQHKQHLLHLNMLSVFMTPLLLSAFSMKGLLIKAAEAHLPSCHSLCDSYALNTTAAVSLSHSATFTPTMPKPINNATTETVWTTGLWLECVFLWVCYSELLLKQ